MWNNFPISVRRESTAHRCRGVPKVTDFGLAKSIDSASGMTQSEAIVGTPSHMAPEQASGHSKGVGPAADIDALGAIFYELLTGRPPFRGVTLLETLEQVRWSEQVAASRLVLGLPRDAETIALTCLGKDPAKRYASAAALAQDLRRFREGEPILARRAGVLERSWRWARRRKALAGSLAAAAVLLVIPLRARSRETRRRRQDAALTQAQTQGDLPRALWRSPLRRRAG